jgi:hypothetical protein
VPRWRADGRELFYISRGRLMSVDMTDAASTTKVLFPLPGFSFEVSPDGQRFLIDRPLDDNSRSPLTFISNWMAERK